MATCNLSVHVYPFVSIMTIINQVMLYLIFGVTFPQGIEKRVLPLDNVIVTLITLHSKSSVLTCLRPDLG